MHALSVSRHLILLNYLFLLKLGFLHKFVSNLMIETASSLHHCSLFQENLTPEDNLRLAMPAKWDKLREESEEKNTSMQ